MPLVEAALPSSKEVLLLQQLQQGEQLQVLKLQSHLNHELGCHDRPSGCLKPHVKAQAEAEPAGLEGALG